MKGFGKHRQGKDKKHGHKHHSRQPHHFQTDAGEDQGKNSERRAKDAKALVDANQCVGCGRCVSVCKAGAISMSS